MIMFWVYIFAFCAFFQPLLVFRITQILDFDYHLVFLKEHSVAETRSLSVLMWNGEEAPTDLGLTETAIVCLVQDFLVL
jgi:hypothetical protein